MRRGRTIFLAIAAVMAPAAALAQPKPNGGEIACVFEHVDPADVEAAWDANGAPNGAQSAAAARVRQAAEACQMGFRWSHQRTEVALVYALARVRFDGAIRDLSAWGITAEVVDQVAADLGERGRAALTHGDESPDNVEFVGATVARSLANAHISIPRGSPQWGQVGRGLGRALLAMRLRDHALDQFTAP